MAPATAAQLGQPLRSRNLRSASRQIDHVVDVRKPTRRSARQASVASDHDHDHDPRTARPEATRHPPALETVVESTPQPAVEIPYRSPSIKVPSHSPATKLRSHSPAALSEMSGTTAISSFSMTEAEFLEPRYILKHMRKLCDSADEFLEYLAPDAADMRTDLRNLTELQKPDSEFTDDYRDYDVELNVHLRHYKNEDHAYIRIRTLHRALFRLHDHGTTAQTGLDLILYLANLLIFVKQIITSNRTSNATWDLLRQLDNSFPSDFMPDLVTATESTVTGESALCKETFELALELRTQLAIMVLAHQDSHAHHDQVIDDVFVGLHPSDPSQHSVVRGWGVPGLKAGESLLPREFQVRVVRRCDELRELLAADNRSPEEQVAFLEEQFPWEPTLLRLLNWARLRRRELKEAINRLGGATAIARNVQQTVKVLDAAAEEAGVAEMDEVTGVSGVAGLSEIMSNQQRKKRKSFGRDRRRSSRKFDPNAPIDPRLIDALKARERLSGNSIEVQDRPQIQEEDGVEPTVEKDQDEVLIKQFEPTEPQPEQEKRAIEELVEQVVEPTLEDNENATLVAESPHHLTDEELRLPTQEYDEEEQAQIDKPSTNGPPKSTADLLSALKAVSNPQKENRPVRLFDRHANAQRVEFGTGFDDSQPTPGPSNPVKAQRQAQPSRRKRSRPCDTEEESETDEFETIERGSRVQQQRQKAQSAKRVRINGPSSGAPPSHQIPRRGHSPEQSLSDDQAPDMTEVHPPSSYRAQHLLAQQNRLLEAKQRERKAREAWTVQEEEAFIEYMAMYPGKYATILERDHSEGQGILQNRSQVNLKDKARTMAINMIKSRTGPSPGFEGIIKPTNKDGRMLIAQGYRW